MLILMYVFRLIVRLILPEIVVTVSTEYDVAYDRGNKDYSFFGYLI